MQWKFWKRWRQKNGSSEIETEEPAPDTTVFPSLLTLGGAKEILALQQTIGNQAVMRIVAPERAIVSVRREPE